MSRTHVVWDCAGNCSSPFTTTVTAAVDPKRGAVDRYVVVTQKLHPLWVDILTRCRKCESCRKAHQREWTTRAKAEWHCAARTWWGTLTVRPEALAVAEYRARAHVADWFALDEAKRFQRIHDELSKEWTLGMKRLRKAYKAPLRYVLVCEAHKSGVPHYHCMVYQVRGDPQLTKSMLEHFVWRSGFVRWRLAPTPAVAGYVCKYLAKDARARVRASQYFGQGKTVSTHSFDPRKRNADG